MGQFDETSKVIKCSNKRFTQNNETEINSTITIIDKTQLRRYKNINRNKLKPMLPRSDPNTKNRKENSQKNLNLTHPRKTQNSNSKKSGNYAKLRNPKTD